MTDEQLTAEELDPDEIGDDPTGDLQYPPDRYVGALDPTNVDGVYDSVESRTSREVPDVIVSEEDMGRPLADDELPDASTDLDGTITEERDLSAEEVAMHIEE
jgi:hypothetical protein